MAQTLHQNEIFTLQETDIFIWGYLKIIPRTPGPNTKDKVEDIW